MTITQISAGTCGSACALASTGAAYCWGLGTSGQLGNNTIANSNVPVPVYGRADPDPDRHRDQIFACGLTSAGAAYCWGDDTAGQLGNNSLTQQPRAGGGDHSRRRWRG